MYFDTLFFQYAQYELRNDDFTDVLWFQNIMMILAEKFVVLA